jgi:hypothetical protein
VTVGDGCVTKLPSLSPRPLSSLVVDDNNQPQEDINSSHKTHSRIDNVDMRCANNGTSDTSDSNAINDIRPFQTLSESHVNAGSLPGEATASDSHIQTWTEVDI